MTHRIIPLFVCALLASNAFAEASRPKAPFRVLHGNDTTNITSCEAPWKDARTGISEKFMRASVDEAADTGIDVQMLQPGMGWVPWWPSTFLPMSEHAQWKTQQGLRLDGWYEQFVLEGGDFVKAFVEECRAKGQHPFISFRMNDQHHIYAVNSGKGMDAEAFEKKAGVYRFYAEHPDWRIGDDGYADGSGRLSMDFAVPQVRQYRLGQIKELIENYDIDGIELDFMRHWALFNQKRTTQAQREEIFTGLVAEVRAYLDAAQKRDGKYRYLGVRIPGYMAAHGPMGINLPRLAEAGVDIVNASGHYFTDIRMDIAPMRAQLPEHVSLYEELQFTNAIGAPVQHGDKTQWPPRRCTPQQLWTAAYLARKRGADGVSTFNFQYYRGTYNPTDVGGDSAEPPYWVFKNISDLNWLAAQPQHYAVGFVWNSHRLDNRPFQKAIEKGKPASIDLDMTPPAGGWRTDGKLRIQARESLEGTSWRARLNGQELQPLADVSEPYPNPYNTALGQPADYRAWKVPANLPKDGKNTVDLLLEGGAPQAYVFFMDIAMP